MELTITATGTPAPTYRWQVQKNSANWENIENAATQTYSIDSATTEMNGKYRCVVTNVVGEVISNEISLTVNKIQMPTPNAVIDYNSKKLTGLTANAEYKITSGSETEAEKTADSEGKIVIEESWFNSTILIKAKAPSINHLDSQAQNISIPNRPEVPSGISAVNETVSGRNDGQITGTNASMEYRLSSSTDWTDCADSTISSLVPGTYEVRVAATNSSFASASVQVNIATGDAPTYTLNIEAPVFEAAEYGYSQPSPKAIKIINTGNSSSNIQSVTLSSSDSFELENQAGSNSIDSGDSIENYTIKPLPGLNAGTYTVTITVVYTDDARATADVSFIVRKAPQVTPAAPELETKTHNAVTLKEIQANSNGAAAQYSKDNGITWQDGREFTGLSPNTSYSFVARYKETTDGNHRESEKSTITEIATYNAPSGESAGALHAVYVAADGKPHRVENSVYDEASVALVFSTNHFSIYGVGYDAAADRFIDTKNHWAKDAIDYVSGRNLLIGSSENTFSPSEKMTRGMLVTVLGRLAGVKADSYTVNTFSDVKSDSPYRAYIEWAHSVGIVSGTGENKFAPDRSITREEIAVIFERYAEATNFKLPANRAAAVYADESQIGEAYRQAVAAMQRSGIMTGTSADTFSPKGHATRAEASLMLLRYIKLTIMPETALIN